MTCILNRMEYLFVIIYYLQKKKTKYKTAGTTLIIINHSSLLVSRTIPIIVDQYRHRNPSNITNLHQIHNYPHTAQSTTL